MFGITNQCNLQCDFCSRDTSRESGWSVKSAAEVLRGLSDAGLNHVVSRAPPLAVWQSFSGNNSGECIVVAKFETTIDADKYLAELMPGFSAHLPISESWRALFETEGVATANMGEADDDWVGLQLESIGKTVFVLGYGVDDTLPEVRALAWKRGAYVVPGGVHEHGPITMLAACRRAGQRQHHD